MKNFLGLFYQWRDSRYQIKIINTKLKRIKIVTALAYSYWQDSRFCRGTSIMLSELSTLRAVSVP